MTRDELIENNLGLVHLCAKKFVGRGVDYDDLYSSGCIGLIKAVDNFDESLGYKLSTYAVPVILGEIKRIFRDDGIIKISRNLKELALKAKKICDEYKEKNECDIPISMLAQELNIDVYKASEVLSISRPVMSLTTDDDTKNELCIKEDSIEDKLLDKITVEQLINTLKEDDKELIKLRYFKHQTQSQVAQTLSMTQVQVSRKEKKILTMLRQKLA